MRFSYALTAVALSAAALVSAPGTALAAWSTGDDAVAALQAAQLPRGGVPAARRGSAPSSMRVTWPDRSVADGIPVDGYRVIRVDAMTGDRSEPSGSCGGVVAGTGCTDIGIPDGRWTYRVQAVMGAHWRGPWSDQDDPVLISATPGAAAVTFPAAGARYRPEQFVKGCDAGFCGTAAPAGGTALTEVRISLRRDDGRYWNPSTGAFTSRNEIRFAVDSGRGSWKAGFPAERFPEGAAGYRLRVFAEDDAGGQAIGTVEFTVDVPAEKPGRATPDPEKPAEKPAGEPAPVEPAPGGEAGTGEQDRPAGAN